ncbi:MAG TPA: SDR family NAD(P)-dependent oxidoreductase [Pyrinomonadaceae bacterium]|nr:SDR family NAD(P)-dependent oxidoreductase [Pyrinomonadaceae bacterium]
MSTSLAKALSLSALAGIAGAAFLYKATRHRYSFQEKVVLITGGSRGLGLVLARELAGRGAKIAICGRDGGELQRAKEDLESRGAEVFDAVCDMREQTEVAAMIDDVLSRFGRIDVLVNNAGVIQVGPVESQTQEDFEEAMRIHFWGPFYAMQAVLPDMKRRGEGRIVNISSIGGKIAVPHLVPYCASKFALAGLSSGMQTELAKDGVLVTTVYPGLMRTGSHINALFKGQNEKEFALFSIANGSPLTSVSAESAARQIANAAEHGKPELVISPQAKAAVKIHNLFPNVTSSILAATNQLLPRNGGIGPGHATGLESTSPISPSIVTSMVDAASYRNNELKPNESI